MSNTLTARGRLSAVARSCVLLGVVASSAQAQDVEAGRRVFAGRCANCHGTEGGGGELGPSIVARVPLRNDQELEAVIREGVPGSGMPAFPGSLAGRDHRSRGVPADAASAHQRRAPSSQRDVAGGRTLEGIVLNQSHGEMQLLGDDRARAPAPRDHRGPVPRGDVAGGVARLQRTAERQSIQPARRHHRRQRRRASPRNGCSRCRTPRSCR